MSAFAAYFIGYLILVLALGIAAYLLNVPTLWIVGALLVAIGAGFLGATRRTKTRARPTNTTGIPDQSPPSSPTK